MTLQDLRERVAGATGPDRVLDRDLFIALVPCDRAPWRYWAPVDEEHGHGVADVGRVYYAPHCAQTVEVSAYTASIGAAVELVDTVRPEAAWVMSFANKKARASIIIPGGGDFEVYAPTPALALISALLAALDVAQVAPEARRSTAQSVGGSGLSAAAEQPSPAAEPNPPNAPSNQES